MARRREYSHKLSDREVLGLIKKGLYSVCVKTGVVIGQRGRPLSPFADKDGSLFVRLHFDGDWRRAISLSRLVWMVWANRTVPKGFEIHHQDRNKGNNCWSNLYCLYKDDHNKLHNGGLLKEEIPF